MSEIVAYSIDRLVEFPEHQVRQGRLAPLQYEPVRTGIVCPECKRPAAEFAGEYSTFVVYRCPACGYMWRRPSALQPQTPIAGHITADHIVYATEAANSAAGELIQLRVGVSDGVVSIRLFSVDVGGIGCLLQPEQVDALLTAIHLARQTMQ